MDTICYILTHGDLSVGFLDFTRCQRADGSHYGTAGQCRKGREVDAKIKELISKLDPHKFGLAEKGFEKLGQGAYGSVYDVGDGVVVKQGAISKLELEVMDKLKHIDGIPRVISSKLAKEMTTTVSNEDNFHIGIVAMTKVPGVPVHKLKSQADMLQAYASVIPKLKKIHQADYAHNDLHGANIFFNPETRTSSIIDFGRAKKVSPKDVDSLLKDLRSVRVGIWGAFSMGGEKDEIPIVDKFLASEDVLHKATRGRVSKKEKHRAVQEFWDSIPD